MLGTLIDTPPTAAAHDAARSPSALSPSAPWALAGLALSMLLSSLGTSVANVGLPTLARTFGASFQAVQWIVLAYLLAITTLIVGVARLGDRFGRRRLLLAGIALFTGASIACGLAPALPALIAARAAQGLGAAVMMALTMAFVGETVPETRAGRAMGLLGTMSAIGTALGPSLGRFLVAGLGWRALFLVNVPLGAVALVLAHRHLPADRPARLATHSTFDGAGMLVLALTLGAYALAMTTGRGRFGALNVALFGGAALGVALFMRVETRSASPLIEPSMFRDRVLGAGLLVNALVSTVMMATLVVGPLYLTRALGLTPTLVGLALSVGPLVTAAAGVPAGRAADRFGARRSAIVGLGTMAVGAALLCAIPVTVGVAGYLAPIVVVTVGYALFQTGNNTAVMADVGPEQRGGVAGMLSLSRNLGLVTGASVMGAVFALGSGAVEVATASPTAVAVGMRITFGAAAALIAIALRITSAGHPTTRDRASDACTQHPPRLTDNPMETRLNFYSAGPDAMKAMAGLEQQIARSGLEKPLVELVRLRASQINGCAYCIDLHTTQARQAGESERRLATASVWHETSFFGDRERAALEWTESVTRVADTHVPDAVWGRVRAHFTPVELVDLTLLVATINAWNRFAIAFRKLPA